MGTLLLYGTPLSHFTRKVRILLLELGLPFQTVRPPDLLGPEAAPYGDNPLLRVPTLVHDGQTLVESDHIARYLARTFDPADRFDVLGRDVAGLNRLAVANGVMGNEVTLILTQRGGFDAMESVAYFRKLRTGIDAGLAWLDAHVDADGPELTYADFAIVAMWQHALHYGIAKEPGRHVRLAARVERLSDRPSVAATTPEASLADAAAWTQSAAGA